MRGATLMIGALLAGACGSSGPAPAMEPDAAPHTATTGTVERGEYLVDHVLVCGVCHTPNGAAAERGRYLASAACLNCHTEQLSADVPNLDKAFAGGKKYTFIRGAQENTSVNITPDATGLAGWSVADIVAALKTNTEKGT